MEKIYIVEGADGVGKTTLVNAIAEAVDGVVVHNTAPEDGPIERVKQNFRQVSEAACALAIGGRSTIFDRLHLSNIVYAVTRDPIEDFLHLHHGYDGLEEMLSGLPVERILVKRVWHWTRKSLMERGEHHKRLFHELFLFEKLAGPEWHPVELGEGGATHWAMKQLGFD